MGLLLLLSRVSFLPAVKQLPLPSRLDWALCVSCAVREEPCDSAGLAVAGASRFSLCLSKRLSLLLCFN